MVVLSRKKNESIIIHDNIIVTVIEIRGDKVRLGIELPREVPIHRKEVYDAIRRIEESPAAQAPTQPPTIQPHFPVRQPDKLDRLASALQSRLAVSVNRELVVQAMTEAGIELPNLPAASPLR